MSAHGISGSFSGLIFSAYPLGIAITSITATDTMQRLHMYNMLCTCCKKDEEDNIQTGVEAMRSGWGFKRRGAHIPVWRYAHDS
eukprot:1362801-Amorphochlora_amoeboformis.AAC.3